MAYYIIIENEQIITCGESPCGTEGIISYEVSEELYNAFKAEPLKFTWNGEKIVENPNYEADKRAQEREKQRQLLIEQIDELDKKRIRAVCEPSYKEEGVTWLDYYNAQIQALREQLNNL